MGAIHTVTSREFGHNVSSAKHLAREGPLFITDRGEPAFVLLHIEEYRRMSGTTKSLVDLLALPEADEMDFDIEPVRIGARELEG